MSDAAAFVRLPREPQTREEKEAQRVQRRQEADSAMRDYRAEEQALRDRTAKLRADRLAREQVVDRCPSQGAPPEVSTESKSGRKRRSCNAR